MTIDLSRQLSDEVERYRVWMSTIPVESRRGEWEEDYVRWPALAASAIDLLDNTPGVDLSEANIADLLFTIARDNEGETLGDHLAENEATLLTCAIAVVDSSEADAKWQLAEQLGGVVGQTEKAESILLQLVKDKNDYVRRRAASALGVLAAARYNKRREAIEADLLECDGTCRDINFAEHMSVSSASAIIRLIGASWVLKQATSGEGDDLDWVGMMAFLDREAGTLSTIWNEGKNPNTIQLFLCWAEPGKIFCEMTFFPDDCARETFSLEKFLMLLANLVSAASSREYYVRFEDASWSHQRLNRDSTIFSHTDFALPDC